MNKNWSVLPVSEITLLPDKRSASLFAIEIYYREEYIAHLSADGKTHVANKNKHKIRKIYLAQGKDCFMKILAKGGRR